MNEKTAQHLNALRDLAQPYEWHQPTTITEGACTILCETGLGQIGQVGDTYGTHHGVLRPAIIAAIGRALPGAQAAEIRAAAAEDRPAETPWQSESWYHLQHGMVHRLAIAAAADEIRAIIARHNAETRAAYEAYRRACAQGTALPPTP